MQTNHVLALKIYFTFAVSGNSGYYVEPIVDHWLWSGTSCQENDGNKEYLYTHTVSNDVTQY